LEEKEAERMTNEYGYEKLMFEIQESINAFEKLDKTLDDFDRFLRLNYDRQT